MDDFNSESDSDYTSYWRDWAISSRDGYLTDHRAGGIDIMTLGPTDTDGHSFPASPPSPGPLPVLPPSPGNRVKASKKRRASEVEDLDIPLHLVTRRFLIEERAEPLKTMDSPRFLLATSSDRALQTLSLSSSNFPPLARQSTSIVSSPDSIESDGTLATYRARFISSRGNEYFCEIDEDYLTDRFNLTGIQTEVQYYQYALDLVTDVFDLDCDDEMRETIEKSARHLYGLVHARYIVTTRGLAKMLEKYKKADFGKCPRVMCKSHPLLPMGQSDNPNIKAVKLYCARCEDIYNPKSSRHSAIDGAYFGTSFHNILFQVYPAMIPAKSYDRYVPRIYGFKVHAPAALIRWQNGERDEMRRRLRKLEIESGFKDEDGEEMDESEEEEEDEEELGGLGNGQVVGGDAAGRS